MDYLIKKVNKRPFQSSEEGGGMIDYFWYKATRLSDGVTIEFGSRNEYKVDQTVDLELEKKETAKGGIRYTEPSRRDE